MDEDRRLAAGDEDGINIPDDPRTFEAPISNDPDMFGTPITIDLSVFDAPLPIDPRLLDLTPTQWRSSTHSPTNDTFEAADQLRSPYVGTRGDLSLPELFTDRTLTASSNPMQVPGDTSSLSYDSTRRDASQGYQTLSRRSRSRYAPTPDEYSPRYPLLQSSDPMSTPFDTSHPGSALTQQEYVTLGEPVWSYPPPLTQEEYTSPYSPFPRSSYPILMPSGTLLPNSAPAPAESTSSYPPLTTEEQSSPYQSFRTTSHPMPLPVDSSVSSSALMSNFSVPPEEYRSPYPPLPTEEQSSPSQSFRTSSRPMPLPVDSSVPSSALMSNFSVPPEEYRSPYTRRRNLLSMPKPVDTRTTSPALTSEDHAWPEEHGPLHVPRRRRFRSMRKPLDTPSSSFALPPRDTPHVHQSSPTRSNLIPMPVDSLALTSEEHLSTEDYTSPYAPRQRRLLSMPKPVDTLSSSLALPPLNYPQLNQSSPSSSSMMPMPVNPPSGYGPESGYGPQPSYDDPPIHSAQPGYGNHPSNVHPPSNGVPPIYSTSSGQRYYLSQKDEPSQGPPASRGPPTSGGPPASHAIPIAWGPWGVRQWPRDAGLVVYGSRIYTDVCGVVSPSKVPPGGAPATNGHNNAQDKLQCPICESRFDRYRSVTTHFKTCVERNGNPEGKFWLDHPSLSRWRGPRFDQSLYMKNRPAYNALKHQERRQYQLLAPAPPREEATGDEEMKRLAEDALKEASKQREEDGGS